MVASRYKFFAMIRLPLVSLFAIAVLVWLPSTINAHQVTNLNGSATTTHHHAYKRTAYGSGLTSGHVAPTRHGNNMILWSPAPYNAYGSSSRQIRIVKPNRQRNIHPRRATRNDTTLRNLNPRTERR